MKKHVFSKKRRLEVGTDRKVILNDPSFLRDVHVNHLLSQAVRTVLDELKISCCGIWLLDNENKFIPRIVFGVKEELYAMSHSKRFSKLLSATVRRKKHIIIHNLAALKDKKFKKAIKKEKLNSLIAYPIISRDFPVGVLVACVRKEEELLIPDRVKTGHIIARDMALILDNIYLYKKTLETTEIKNKDQKNTIMLVKKIRNMARITDDIIVNTENLLKEIHKLCSVDLICVKKHDPKKRKFATVNIFPSYRQLSSQQKTIDAMLDEELARRMGPLAINNIDIYCREALDTKVNLQYKSYLSFPMLDGKTMIGVVSMYWKYPRILGEIEYRAIETICSMLSVFTVHSELLGKVKNGALNAIKTLATLTEAKDEFTHGHSKKVMHYSVLICKKLNLSVKETEIVKKAAFLHDLGKVVIDNRILHKDTPLNESEWSEIKKHPEIGANIVSQTGFLSNIASAIRYHHAKFSGGGYPDPKIKRYEIPLAARIISVADAYDAMSSDRAYRRALNKNYAMAQLHKHSGKQFDPQIVRAFRKAIIHS